MKEALLAFLFSVGSVTLAEMGDKTQLLAMAFATRVKEYKVLVGIFIATIFNHALAVAVGTYLTKLNSLQSYIQLVASLSFIIFGLWTIRGDKLEEEEIKKPNLGEIATVAIAFFIAELGDKTQLTTIALATKFSTVPIWILMGTTIGMLVADSIGIIFGVVMSKRIPYKKIKIVSAAIFCIFGFVGTGEVFLKDFNFGILNTAIILIVIVIITLLSAFLILKSTTDLNELDVKNHSCNTNNHYKN